MGKQVGTTYGDALFELAVEEGKLDGLTEEVKELTQIWKENEDLGKILTHPEIAKEEKKRILTSVFSGKLSSDMEGFLLLLIQKDRIGNLEEICTRFIDRMKEYRGIGVVMVTSAVELNSEQKQKLEQKLLESTGYKELEVSYSVNPELIAGLIIRIGDRVVDSSFQLKLTEMKYQLLKLSCN